MGLSLGGGRRRSYADYERRRRPRRGGSDPFRIIIYLALIGGLVWFYYNRDRFLTDDLLPNINVNPENGGGGGSQGPTPTPPLEAADLALQAEQAYAEGNLDAALESYQQAAELAPNTIDYHIAVTRLLLLSSATQYEGEREDTLAEALDAADRAILADPESAKGYAIKAMALDWNGRAEEASLQAQRAIEIDPNYAVAHAYLAEAYVDMNRWEQAEEAATQALDLDPFDADVQRNYGYVYESLGQYDVAAQHYEQAVTINPNLPFLQLSLARAYRALGRTEDSIDHFTAVSGMLPDNPVSYMEIGWTYHTVLGDDNAALEYLEQAIELDTSYTLAWVRIGTIHYVRENWAEAADALERAVELSEEDDIDIILQLGVSLANLGECNDAARYLRQAQQLAGGDERVESITQSALEQCADAGITLATPTTPAESPTPFPAS